MNLEQKENALSWTGERFLPAVSGQVRYEHFHRYAMCLNHVKGKKVLDIACGEGYGSAILAGSAASVVGVDVSEDAVKHAKDKYARVDNLSFQQGSVDQIPVKTDSIDVVVSFETIEHVDCHQEMLSEIKRVLKSDGILIISTPDKDAYAAVSPDYNEYHVKELLYGEFKDLLLSSFNNVLCFGQRLATGSLIFPLVQIDKNKSYDAWTSDREFILDSTTATMIDPVYIVAICSDVDVEGVNPSIYLDANDDLYSDYVKFSSWVGEMLEQDDSPAVLKEERDAAIRERDMLLNSLSWKITKPLRLVWNTARSIKIRILNVLGNQLWNLLQKIYYWMPVSPGRKLMLKNLVFRIFPGLHKTRYFNHIDAINIGNLNESLRKIHEFSLKEKTAALSAHETDSLSSFFIKSNSDPRVSIVIPVYGQIGYTLMCLRSLARVETSIPYEVVIVDDKSPDDTPTVLTGLKGITVITNESNKGFIKSCNSGASAAKGEYLVFLNNDTEILDGWLEGLIKTFESINDAGIVGSKLLYPDGRLQEAGCIVWNDGSAWNYGRYDDPGLPEYNYLREVDYCSGASIAIPRLLFEQVGGFDEHYLPAYAEDSDLAFKVRATGKKVYYQPLSAVVHYEGVTSGTDTGTGVKAYQVENAKKLFERWRLEMELLENPGKNVVKAKDKGRIGHILILDHCTPTPDMDAGSITVLNIMRILLSLGYQVTFVPDDNFLYMPGYTACIQSMGVEAIYAPHCLSVKKYLKGAGGKFNAVIIFRPSVAERHLSHVERYCSNAMIIYHVSDLHYLRLQRQAELGGSGVKQKEVKKMLARELDIFQRAQASIVHSSTEADILINEHGVKNVHIFPWAIDIQGTETGFVERKNICFIGGYQHVPNVDAAIYFITEVFPLLSDRLPDVKFYAIGSNPPERLKKLATDRVVVTGYVEDLYSFVDKMRVAVAPLRYGAGIKGKVATTLSMGLPCVATEIAAEGMGLVDGENIVLANTASEIADKVVDLYNDYELWSRLSLNGIYFAEHMYGYSKGIQIVEEILGSVSLPYYRDISKDDLRSGALCSSEK